VGHGHDIYTIAYRADNGSIAWSDAYNGPASGPDSAAELGTIRIDQQLSAMVPKDVTVYDEQGQLISSLIGGNPLRYEEIVWIDNIPVGRVLSSTSAVLEVHAIHSDHLNTPRALANAQSQGGQAAGTVVWRWRLNATSVSGSNAFGAQAADENPDGNGTSVRFDLRFPGQQWDASVGLSYNYFRDYEAGTGRYVESDPIGLYGGINTYTYVYARPLVGVDPNGQAAQTLACLGGPVPCAIAIGVSAIVGICVANQVVNGPAITTAPPAIFPSCRPGGMCLEDKAQEEPKEEGYGWCIAGCDSAMKVCEIGIRGRVGDPSDCWIAHRLCQAQCARDFL